MSGHTKGKWRRKNRNVFVMHDKIRIFIASVFKCMPGGKAESDANAKLIAAAPDLLTACEVAVLALTFEPINPEDIEFIKKAIAEATK
ncbi:hypothetical protein LCGC14_0916210 [marine sediment metagenome]|uniref:Uncharacterized protein n=1 Tax=marine sediment metagenome TaxID=412755 RepID=A0A0F9NS91_9ZZZZ